MKNQMISGVILCLAALAFFNAGCKTLPSISDIPDIAGPIIAQPETGTNDVAGIPAAALPVTASVSDVAYGKSKVTWRMSGTESWPKKTVKKEVQGMTYLYVWRGDKWQGGKFDWFRPGQMSKGYENIHDNYMGVIPSKGDRVAFGLLDIRKAQRSNFVEGVWP